jgi:CubicO group peptidase (beta-lactamase class C family)
MLLAMGVVLTGATAMLAMYAQRGLAVATGYAAKVTCSLTLNSRQPADEIRRQYLDRELFPVSRRLTLRPADCCASAGAFGIVRARAVYRPGMGCTLLAGRGEDQIGMPEGLRIERVPLDASVAWPRGEQPLTTAGAPAIEAAIDVAFAEPAGDGDRIRQTKAVLIAHEGRLIAERYAAGYGPDTPMLSWSMAKSVLAAVVGIAVSDGRLALHEPAAVPEWRDAADPRRAITLDQLLRMSSGLAFDETYGAINDVSRMLFTEPDVGAYAAAKPLASAPDTAWSYSSGTSNVVARILRDTLGGYEEFARYAHERLFAPALLRSAFFEADASGTPIGSSFVFMTPRDWARFGELHRNDGVVDGVRVLPQEWVRYVTTPTPRAPKGQYGAHWWLNAGDPAGSDNRPWPELPSDAYAARGHSGQWVLVIPSRSLVIVRLGMSFPDDGVDGTVDLARAVLAGLPAT